MLPEYFMRLNEIKDFWSKNIFLGKADFKRVTHRNESKEICSVLKLYPVYDHAVNILGVYNNQELCFNIIWIIRLPFHVQRAAVHWTRKESEARLGLVQDCLRIET